MTNPLIEKYNNLRSPKEEKPKEQSSLTPIDPVLNSLTGVLTTNSSGSTITKSNISATNAYVSAKPKAFQTYDFGSSKDVFLGIVEKVKQGDAKVTCVTFHTETIGMFSTGLQTVTFEVQYLDGF